MQMKRMPVVIMQRSTFLKLRVSRDEVEGFNARAAALGVSVSQLIRDTALHGAVFVTLEKAQAGYEFRRLGAMLKHLYPARDIRWTAEDRKKWWALINELRERADTLESTASGGKDKAVGMVHAG
jgi:hypothetical protein